MATPPSEPRRLFRSGPVRTWNDRSLHRDRGRLRGVLASRSEDPGGRGALPAGLGSRHGHPGPAPHEVGQPAGRPPPSEKRRSAVALSRPGNTRMACGHGDFITHGFLVVLADDAAAADRTSATRHGRITCPLPTTVIPPSDTTNPRARSCSLSTPTVAPASTTTFLSRIAFSTTARRPTRELCRTTARSTRAQLCT